MSLVAHPPFCLKGYFLVADSFFLRFCKMQMADVRVSLARLNTVIDKKRYNFEKNFHELTQY